MDPLVGSVILERYQIESVLGTGGMGRVYLARHTTLNTRVAIKVLTSDDDPAAHDRFRREAELMAKVRHPNVVSVLDFGFSAEGQPCIVMEYVEGVSLEDHLLRGGAMPWGDACALTLGVLAGLEAVHGAGIMHRDLKTSNVILVEGDIERPKLIDFGIAKPLDPAAAQGALTRTGILVGTPAYMSPEQLVGAKVDHRADLYAAGLIWYECATGKLLFEGDEFSDLLRRVREPAPVPVAPSALPEIPDAVSDVALSALSTDPADRPPDARAFAARLRSAMRIGRGSRPPVATDRRSAPPMTRPPVSLSPASPRARFLIAAVLPPTRLALAEERRWLSEQLGERARAFSLGAQVWIALQSAPVTEVDARRDAEALCRAVMDHFGPTAVASWAVVEPDFALTASQLTGMKPLPPALRGLLDAML